MGDSDQHYWVSNPQSTSRKKEVQLLLPDVDLSLTTDRGVFSANQVDKGTRYLLMEGPSVPASVKNILDLGCGYGPIACTLGERYPDAKVWATDTNIRALELCRLNAEKTNSKNILTCLPEEIPEDISFDSIWSNPPIRIGKESLHELLLEWLNRLSPNGSAHFVIQRHLGSDSLAKWLETKGWNTSRRGSRKGFRLLDVTRRESDEES